MGIIIYKTRNQMVKISLAAALLLAVSDAVSLTKLTCDAVTLTKVTDADTLEDLTKAVENVADIDQAFSDDDASDADADSDHASADDSEHDDDDDTASEQLTLTEQFEQTLADIKGPDIKGRPLFIGDSDIEGCHPHKGHRCRYPRGSYQGCRECRRHRPGIQ